MTYKILVNDRKQIVAKMEEFAGEKPVYTRMPRCAYILRGIAVEKNGEVTTEEGADLELIRQLIGIGMISSPAEDCQMQTTPVAMEEQAFEEEQPTEEQTEEETLAENEQPEEPAESVEETVETTEWPESEENDEDPESIESEVTEDSDPYAELEEHELQAIKVTVSFPLEEHKTESICNLVNTIYSKGSLISKATQGTFKASEELVKALQSESVICKDDALETIRSMGADSLQGLTFEEDRVTFDGFPATVDPDVRGAWIALATAINRIAIKQHHVRARETDESNEKFAFRTWLTRLGMNGPDMKKERIILYRHLSGHTAFKTGDDQERWTKRQQEKRDALKRPKEAAMDGVAREAAQ